MGDFKILRKAKISRPYQKVADQLLADIVATKYTPGKRLPSERRLSEQFGVGRPVIREAIIALEIVGAVSVKPNSGIYVLQRSKKTSKRDFDLDVDVGGFELLEARMLIEGEVAFRAASVISNEALEYLDNTMDEMRAANSRGEIDIAEKFDDRFHEIIADQINNSVLYSVVAEMNIAHERSPLAKRLFARIHGKGVGRRIEEHESILDALRARNPHGARAAMRRHLGCVLAELAAANELEMATNPQTNEVSATNPVANSARKSIF